ncbi:MAG: lysoplasmalogenase, partial [Acidobacteriota bacterium]
MDRASAHNRNFAAALGTLAVLAYGVGLALQHFPLRLVAKPWPVLVLVWFLLQDGRHSYGQRIRWGLLACIAGDLLLEAGPATFLPAMAAFLVGHLSFITAFLERSRAPRLGLAAPSFGLGATVLAWLWPGLEGSPLAVPVVIYSTVLCAMLWRGAAGLGSGRG